MSDDGGFTWVDTHFNDTAQCGGVEVLGVAIGAWASETIVVLVGNNVPYVTVDGGKTWSATTGLPNFTYPRNGFSGNRYNMSRPLSTDRSLTYSTARRFLYADCASGRVYTSEGGECATISLHTISLHRGQMVVYNWPTVSLHMNTLKILVT